MFLLSAAALPLIGLRHGAVTPRARLTYRLCLLAYVVVAAVALVLLVRDQTSG